MKLRFSIVPNNGDYRIQKSESEKPKLGSGLRFGFAEACDTVTGFPCGTLFQDFDALKALQDVPFGTSGTGGAQASML